MSAPGDNIDQAALVKQINLASDALSLPPGSGVRIHLDTQSKELSLLLPFAKKIRDTLNSMINDTDTSISIGGKVYLPRNGESEGSPKIWINIYRKK